MTKAYRELEELVARIQQQLAPESAVLHDQKIPGRKSGRLRQIDVLVKDRVGQYDIQIVIDCKNYKKPADVKAVEEFYGLLDDVGAQKGVLVSPAGFQLLPKPALRVCRLIYIAQLILILINGRPNLKFRFV